MPVQSAAATRSSTQDNSSAALYRSHGRLRAERLDVRPREALRAAHHGLDLGLRQRVAILPQQQRHERRAGLRIGQGDVEALDEAAAGGLVQLVGPVGGAHHEDAVLSVFVCVFVC